MLKLQKLEYIPGTTTSYESRRVQVTGSGTYIISLPRRWVKMHNISKGSEVYIEYLPDDSLRIIPRHKRVLTPRRASIFVNESTDFGFLIRELISYYVMGFDIIFLEFGKSIQDYYNVLNMIKEFIDRRMIGVEVVEETSTSLVLQCLTENTAMPVEASLKRMVRTVDYMLLDVMESLQEVKHTVLRNVVERDDIVDRFYLFVVRQLNAVMLGILNPSTIGLSSYIEAASLRIAAKFIERVGDHAQVIARDMLRTPSRVPECCITKVRKFLNIARDLFLGSTKALFRYDSNSAHKVIDKALKVRGFEDEVLRGMVECVEEVDQVLLLKRLTESTRRIIEYSADISELTINLCIARRRASMA